MRIRFPMFLKFWIGCTVLAAILIVGGLLVVQKETRTHAPNFYLAKHLRRYLAYVDGVGRAQSSVAELVAQDPRLERALAPTAAAPEPAAEVATDLYQRLSDKGGIEPDLFLVFDQSGLVWRSPSSVIDAGDLKDLEVISRVRGGTSVFHKILVHGGRAVLLSAVPITAPGRTQPIGGLLVGTYLDRSMKEYKESSDDTPRTQHRLALVSDGHVVASTFPRSAWPELDRQLQPGNWGTEGEGAARHNTVELKEGEFDFHRTKVEGFGGLGAGTIGDLFLMRGHTDHDEVTSVVPWKELLVGAILSLVIASLLALWITRPIKRFVVQSQRMLEGGADLNQRIEIRSTDETADLAANINQVFNRLYQLASEVQHAAFQVGASSAEISAASKQMLGGLRDQTMKIESSTAAVTELSASIQQVAQNAVEASKVAEKSNVAVTQAVHRMQQIRGAVEDAADKMSELGESSKRIGNIVEVIRQISEQTSLLALNASIEAAHAGEQGRGFAVVADEVSSLARRVGQSAKDIEALIQTIKEQTGEAVRSMQVGTSEVENGTQLVTNTLQDLSQLINVVNDTASAVQEQAMVSDEIARNMDAVQKIASEIVAGSEESVLQGEQLHALAFNLEQSVGGFNIDGTTGGGARAGGGNGVRGGELSPGATGGARAPRAALPSHTPGPRRDA